METSELSRENARTDAMTEGCSPPGPRDRQECKTSTKLDARHCRHCRCIGLQGSTLRVQVSALYKASSVAPQSCRSIKGVRRP